MSSINEYRNKKATEASLKFGGGGDSVIKGEYANGFDAAMDLKLPLLFAAYFHSFKISTCVLDKHKYMTDEEFYNDWLNNVYEVQVSDTTGAK